MYLKVYVQGISRKQQWLEQLNKDSFLLISLDPGVLSSSSIYFATIMATQDADALTSSQFA